MIASERHWKKQLTNVWDTWVQNTNFKCYDIICSVVFLICIFVCLFALGVATFADAHFHSISVPLKMATELSAILCT
jgi:hypothetical protein